jgi:CBS domain containing-hemolysin-like protein
MGTILFFILFFLLLSAFFSGSEIAFISANKIRIELLKEQNTWKGKVLSQFYEKPKDFLGTMLIGNNIALVIFSTLMTKLLEPWLKPFVGENAFLLLIITLISTVVVLIFGEFLPKTLFRVYANRIISVLAMPLQLFKWLLTAPTWLMTKLSNFFLRTFFKVSDSNISTTFSRIDLEHFVQDYEGEEDDELDTDIFKNALKLKEIKVRDCMIPRNEIEAIDEDTGMEEVVQVFDKTRHSRILTYKGDIDNVSGYIHHQQMMKQPKRLKNVISAIPFIPEAMNVHDLMNKLLKDNKNIACVVDEFGGTSGVITLEDILEEIFGEITDEDDQEEYVEKEISDREWLFSGRLEIDYLNEKYENINFPTGEYNTLSGYLVMSEADIPEKDAVLLLDGYKFILEQVSNTKIEMVRVKRIRDLEMH